MKLTYTYTAVLQREERGYSVWIPDVAGCNSYGETIAEALERVKEALGLCLELLEEKHCSFPAASVPEQLTVEPGQVLAIVEFDWLAYQRKYCSRSVKKTLTIPRYLNDLAVENQINFSAVLQEALIEKLNVQ